MSYDPSPQQPQYSPPPPGYGPPPQPPAGWGPAPLAPPKKKSKLPWILGGLLAVLLLCGGGLVACTAFVGDSVNDAVNEVNDNAAGKNAVETGLNQPARDGKFEFTVTTVKCGATSVGSDLLSEKAQGEYCLVDVTVKNIGDVPQMFDGSSQKAFDAKGAEYSHDGVAEMYANEGNATFLETINPGNQVKGRLVFDVPKGTALTEVMLHDSPLSGGVRVNLA